MRARSIGSAVIAAIVVRWLFCFVLFPCLLVNHSTVGATYYFDSYREVAASLLTGNGYALPSGVAVIHRPPGYLALILFTVPTRPSYSYLLLHFLQGLLGGAATFVTYRAGRRLGLTLHGALFAAWIVALWPFAIWESKVTVPENLLLLLVPASFLVSSRVESSFGRAIGAGLITAAAALTHGIYQLLILPVALVVASGATRRLRFRLLATTLIAFMIPVGLWTARNYRLGYPKLSAGLGLHYFKGNYNFDGLLAGQPYFRDTDVAATQYVDSVLHAQGLPPIESDEQRSSVAENEYLDREASRDLVRRPLHTLLKVVVLTPLAWVHQQSASRSAATALLLTPLFLLAFCGLRAHPSLWLIALAIAILNMAAAAIFVQAIPMRYALPWIPLLAILAGSGVEEIRKGRALPRMPSISAHSESTTPDTRNAAGKSGGARSFPRTTAAVRPACNDTQYPPSCLSSAQSHGPKLRRGTASAIDVGTTQYSVMATAPGRAASRVSAFETRR